ncbi:MAG: 1-deoxy-D-xylulose-5-phosphate reductoisomerase [Dehalococcoidia bacterium]|nr:1-deoxy-D-xylulose-5-phosphate reductoisomerase [Dehalococcoidia bacterium]
MKRLAILGSTGSIGTQALDVVRALPDHFRVVALAGGQNLGLLRQQADEFHPLFVYSPASEAGPALSCHGRSIVSPEEMASLSEVDLVVMAIAGSPALSPTLAALRAGKTVALASKEALVMAGAVVTKEARIHGGRLLPVDSEHSAIWQCLQGENGPQEIQRLLLTASGGAFRDRTQEQLKKVSPQEALHHPTWRMGRKVTIDSATLMNKGLEVIEAHWLFSLPFDRINVVMHRESIIHSLVEFVDGSVKAQLGMPDMRLPIQYALTHPARLANQSLPRLDLARLGTLTFGEVEMGRYPCLRLALEAAAIGGTATAVLNAADEVAVQKFLAGEISFLDISRLVERVLDRHQAEAEPDLETILDADRWAREEARKAVN